MFTVRNLVVVCFLIAVMAVPSAAQNLVSNGGFESPVISGTGLAFNGPFAENANALVWGLGGNLSSYNIVEFSTYKGSATGYQNPEGLNFGWFFDANGQRPKIYQTIQSTSGQQYTLEFSALGKINVSSPAPVLRVKFGDYQEDISLLVVSANPYPFQSYTRTLTAGSAADILSFELVSGSFAVDAISLVAVPTEPIPEPAGLFMLATGLTGLVAFKRRTR